MNEEIRINTSFRAFELKLEVSSINDKRLHITCYAQIQLKQSFHLHDTNRMHFINANLYDFIVYTFSTNQFASLNLIIVIVISIGLKQIKRQDVFDEMFFVCSS